MIKISPFLAVLFFVTLSVLNIQGQDATFSQAFASPMTLNPALTGSFGNFSYGYQRELIDLGQTVALTDAVFHKVETIGLAYAINDSLSVSYNTIESKRHNVALDNSYTTKTDAINIGYTVGGITIGFQDAGTDNANFVKDAKDDTRTLSIKAAF